MTSSYAPWANATEERGVKKLSNAIKAVSFGKDTAEWSRNLKFLQLLLNSSTISPYLSTTPFALLMGSENSFFHPLLVVSDDTLPFQDFWNTRVKKLREMNKCLVEKYDIVLSQKSNKRQTVQSMNLKIGDLIWVRVIKYTERLVYLKHLLPKWKLAKIVRFNGMTSLLCLDVSTNQLLSRHLQDCAPVKQTGNYSNLFTDSRTSHSHEIEEDFGGAEANEIPEVLEGSKETVIDDGSKQASKQAEKHAPEKHGMTLRPRKKV